MTNIEISKEVKKLRYEIKNSENLLKNIQKICKHETIQEAYTMVRIGTLEVTTICEICGKIIKK